MSHGRNPPTRAHLSNPSGWIDRGEGLPVFVYLCVCVFPLCSFWCVCGFFFFFFFFFLKMVSGSAAYSAGALGNNVLQKKHKKTHTKKTSKTKANRRAQWVPSLFCSTISVFCSRSPSLGNEQTMPALAPHLFPLFSFP
eukprot:TRINITY_DN7743_c0_g2_i1.p1 TRINITY_DN7743_c0_g2~~TRINITY_DN7743_c0_g2_i1.p1  ORF type:complete len:139 (-),score=7.62 TRINITY_DN7743_c0_g2_i1:360-776(-)